MRCKEMEEPPRRNCVYIRLTERRKREVKKAVFTNSYNAKKAVAPVQKKAPDDKMKSPKTGNDSLMVIWTTMILAVLEKEKRFSLYKEKCNMKKISLLFCLIILQAGLLCGCRLPHKSSPQKPVEGENKSGLVKVQDDKKEEKKEEKEKEKKSRGRQKSSRRKIRNCHFSKTNQSKQLRCRGCTFRVCGQ